jgi:hypothetical protein
MADGISNVDSKDRRSAADLLGNFDAWNCAPEFLNVNIQVQFYGKTQWHTRRHRRFLDRTDFCSRVGHLV